MIKKIKVISILYQRGTEFCHQALLFVIKILIIIKLMKLLLTIIGAVLAQTVSLSEISEWPNHPQVGDVDAC